MIGSLGEKGGGVFDRRVRREKDERQ